jgi:enhancing lycopene biosynthesis protein 2
MKKLHFAVLLSGCGVFDGSEIHEAVLTLLAIDESGSSYQCIAPAGNQYHVINHVDGSVQSQTRNVMEESARIARGNIKSIREIDVSEYDGLIIPGGFGAAKNLNQWAIEGADGGISEEVKEIILNFISSNKPIGAMCMGPTVVAKALQNSGISPRLTVGSIHAESPYNIAAISKGLESIGMKVVMRKKDEVEIDAEHKLVTAPCYMMESSITDIRANTQLLVKSVIALIHQKPVKLLFFSK